MLPVIILEKVLLDCASVDFENFAIIMAFIISLFVDLSMAPGGLKAYCSKAGPTTVSITTFSMKTLSITTFSITTSSIITLGIRTFNIIINKM